MRDLSASQPAADAALAPLALTPQALNLLMPLHLRLDAKGCVTGMGPTMARVWAAANLQGNRFLDLFQVRRPTGITSARKLSLMQGERLQLEVKLGPRVLSLRGLCTRLDGKQGYLLNLSFGVGLVEAVRDLSLTEADFAHTELAIEMLYLVETKSAAMNQLNDLNARLHGAKAAAEQQALTDTLTGLKNRRALEADIERLIRRRTPFALMHLDLDFFKAVNDTLGHAAGDHVLREVAAILNRETRAADTVARVGGDEFVLVFHDLTDQQTLGQVAWRIIAALSDPIEFEGQTARIAGSVGITHSAQYTVPDIEQMHADADTALYESKRQGRARATFFAPDAAA